MQLYIKLYNTIRDTVPFHQDSVISEAVIEKDITAFDLATFRMDIIPGMQEKNKIEICEVNNWNDKIKFTWYVYEIKPIWANFSMQDVICRSEKAIFYDRKSTIAWEKNNMTIKWITEQLIAPYNALWDHREVISDFSTPTSIEVRQWDSFFDIMDEMCKEFEIFWKIEHWIVYINQMSGIDRSVDGQYYEEVYYNDKQPSDSNIVDVGLVGTATRSNIAIIKDRAWNITIDSSRVIDWVIHGVVYEEFMNSSWQSESTEEKTQKLLDRSDRRKLTYTPSVKENTLNADTGDKVKITTEGTNSYYDIDGSLLVLKKTIVYSNGGKLERFSLWEMYSTPFELNDWIGIVERKIRQIQIKD